MNRYFDNEAKGFCYGIDHFKEILKETGEESMELWLATREVGTDHFFCSNYQEVGLKDESGCGKICEGYSPLNGKNGRRKYSKNTYFPSEKYILSFINNKFKLNPAKQNQ